MSDSAAPRLAVRGRRTVTLRDGSRVTLREIAPSDKPLLAASFERLSPELRYRRFFTAKTRLSEAELDYLVNIDHNDHEAVVAIDPATGDVVGVARYIRSDEDHALAEVAVTVADHWQGRGLGRALLGRLTYLARRAGVRRFSAFVQRYNLPSLGLAAGAGGQEQRADGGEVELVVDLPPHRGIGARLAHALRAAAAGSLVPARTLIDWVADAVGGSPPPRSELGAPAAASMPDREPFIDRS